MEDEPDENINRYLDIYYQHLFPFEDISAWLGYGDVTTFSRREFSLKLSNLIIIRNQAFSIPSRFKTRVIGELPLGIDIGAIYNTCPSNKNVFKYFVEKELVFDIDISDYDDVRTCCKGPDICTKCWRYIVIACKILDIYLKHDFGYNHVLWVFSGRRGIHCWVCDKAARMLDQCTRRGILEFIVNNKIIHLHKNKQIHGKILDYYDRRLLEIIEPEFVPLCILDQNLLGTEDGINYFLSLLPNIEAQTDVKQLFNHNQSSIDRWNAFTTYYKNMIDSHIQYWQEWEEFIDYIKLYYCYPKFDANVSEGVTHLLRCPFSVHLTTGKIAIPFNLAEMELFDPATSPTLKQLINEKTNIDKDSIKKDKGGISIYEGSSLKKPIEIFKRFVSDTLKRSK